MISSPVNIIRYVLNCNYGTNLKYLNNVHYKSLFYDINGMLIDEKYGTVEKIFSSQNFKIY